MGTSLAPPPNPLAPSIPDSTPAMANAPLVSQARWNTTAPLSSATDIRLQQGQSAQGGQAPGHAPLEKK